MFKSKNVKQTGLKDAHPVFSYEGHKLVLKDGRVAVGFRIHSAEMENWDVEGYHGAHHALQQAMRTLPAGAVLQKTDVYYDRPYVHPPSAGAYFQKRMGDYWGNKLVLYHQSYLFLSFAPVAEKKTGSATKPKRTRSVTALNAFINKADEALGPNPFEATAATLAAAERHAQEFLEALRGVPDVSLDRLSRNEVEQLYFQFLNLDFDGRPQHAGREMINEIGTLAVGENKLSCISLVGQGSEVHPCVTNGYGVTAPMVYPLTQFLGLPHVLTQAVQIVDTKEELAAMDRDRRLNSSMSFLTTQDHLIRIAEIDAFAAEVRAANKQLCRLHVSLLIWESNDQFRKENVEKAATALRSLYSSEVAVESFLTLPLYFGALPGNAYQIPDRWVPTSTDRAACFVHWTTTYRPTPTGEYICDRFRNLTRVNLFDVNQDNQNSLTIGPSGSGKSFTMGNFIVQRYENGARQIIIDIGGSYRNVCQSLTGADFEKTYFEYDPQRPIEFAPFLLPRDAQTNRWRYNDEKLNFHLALLTALWKSGREGLSKSERALLARFLQGFYADLNDSNQLGQDDERFPCMETFYEFVRATHGLLSAPNRADDAPELMARREQYRKDSSYMQMDEFFLVLGEYVEGGRYAKVLNARRDVDLSEYPLVCFDMAKVKADPTIYPVVAMLITELSLDLFRKFPDAVKYILMDEAWSMLSGAMQDFIEHMYRTIRKTNGSIGIITQGIKEIEDSPIGATIIDNSATKIILRHTNDSTRERLQRPLGFTTHEMSLIASMRSGAGYREFLIKQGPKAKVYALEATPELNAILSSRPSERNYLNRLVERYQRIVPVPMLDAQGRVMRRDDGEPLYTTHVEQKLDFAVDEFVSEKSQEKALAAA